ncbi:MAG: regulatory protein RecX [Flavobacteriaceae bacterium]|nr:recombinase RecX [Flavobacteriales bacterium]RCL68849.1 MAG: RecX family transcriptional regulator [Bacteroidota bacterium]|tara:strand:+ start:650 stop:1117 length:468 start_codon:yes stop_codon:yes gene_type:complete
MPISFTEDEKIIIEKIQSYCLYQDRCIKEVKNKLYSFKVSSQLVENIVEYLIDNDYLNEERYTKMFIQGKLRIKKWGRIKLKYELKSKGIDIKIINEHINQINEEDYIEYFNEFSTNKIKFLKGTLDQKKRSFINYFTYRGWENDLIYQKLRDIN